jgi:hypothetical protein
VSHALGFSGVRVEKIGGPYDLSPTIRLAGDVYDELRVSVKTLDGIIT